MLKRMLLFVWASVVLPLSVLGEIHRRPPLDIKFEDPKVSMIAGIRPFRKGGLRIEHEEISGVHIFHNYGHGGAGITLSWGSVEEAIRLATPFLKGAKRVVVVGGGVIGLTTSNELTRLGVKHSVYSADFSPSITSYIAGGLWKPASVELSYGLDWVKRMIRRSYERYQELDHFAVSQMPYYRAVDLESEDPTAFKLLIDLGHMPTAQNHEVLPIESVSRGGKQYETFLIDTPRYMRDLLSRAQSHTELIERTFLSQAELLEEAGEGSVVFNCTGLGSYVLFNDKNMVPYRGQLVLIERAGFFEPSEDDFMVSFGDYYFPRKEHLVLGGTYEKGEWDPSPNPEDGREILQGHQKFFGY